MTTLLIFLHKNGRWLRVEIDALYEFTMRIAASPAENKDEYLQIINKFIKRGLLNFKL